MRKKFLNTIARLSVSHTWWMTVGILLLTIFFGYRANTLQMRTGFDNLLPGDNPRVEEFNRIIDEFQSESNIMLLAKGEEDSLKAFAEGVKPLLNDFDMNPPTSIGLSTSIICDDLGLTGSSIGKSGSLMGNLFV